VRVRAQDTGGGAAVKRYSVKEIFYTLQGEGANVGRPAVFCRFAGCNLWSGREVDRATATCKFCDTDFVGGTRYAHAGDLADAIFEESPGSPFLVVLTGGEPLLQVDDALIDALHKIGAEIAVETNGTRLPPSQSVDWLCVSPKAGAELVLRSGNELKLIYPQEGAEPERFTHLNFDHFFLQPMDGPHLDYNVKLAIEYCLAHPQWRLSLQTHKILGIR
jgi:7-carboxy-7-deazaguanine synthase